MEYILKIFSPYEVFIPYLSYLTWQGLSKQWTSTRDKGGNKLEEKTNKLDYTRD